MRVGRIAALQQNGDAALCRRRIRREPHREFIVVARCPGKDDRRGWLGGKGVINDGAKCLLEARGYLCKVFNPQGMKPRSFPYNDSRSEWLAGRECLALGRNLSYVFS